MATDGQTATAQLAEADRLARSWGSYPEARAAARDAGAPLPDSGMSRTGNRPSKCSTGSTTGSAGWSY